MIRLGALGDVVRTLPAVSGLRCHLPQAHITWLVERSSSGALSAEDLVDEVRIFPREEWTEALRSLRWGWLGRDALRLRKELCAGRFDLVLDFHGILKSGILARLTGAPVRVGFARPAAREGSWLFSNRRVPLPGGPLGRFQRNLALVEPFGIEPESTTAFRLHRDSAAAGRIDAWLRDRGAPVALHPGTSAATPYKRLPPSTYGVVARRLRAEHRLEVIVTYGPGDAERALAQDVVDASGGAACLGPETPSFADLAALLARCQLFVGSDSGPLHAASLAGTPVVQLLGPTHPVENEPFSGTPSRSLRVGLSCSPCRRGCPEAPCMSLLSAEAILGACRSLLAGAKGAREEAAHG